MRVVNASAIFLASFEGHIEVVKLLLEHGAALNSPTCSPLCGASLAGDIAVAKILIEQGADMSSPSILHTHWSTNPLAAAARSGDVELVYYLISKGANAHYNQRDQNALVEACSCDHLEVVKLLLHHGADVNMQVLPSNTTCMHQACINKNIAMVTYLLDHGADINILDENGVSPFGKAFMKQNNELILYLLDRGADPDAWLIDTPSPIGWTPLMLAAAEGDKDMMMLLLKYGAKINRAYTCEDAHGDDRFHVSMPLLVACEYGQVAALRLLLEHGADAYKPFAFYHNNTPLMYLFRDGLWVVQWYRRGMNYIYEPEPDRSQDMPNCLKLLLEYGADATLANDQGETVNDYVKDPAILQIFAEHSAVSKPLLK